MCSARSRVSHTYSPFLRDDLSWHPRSPAPVRTGAPRCAPSPSMKRTGAHRTPSIDGVNPPGAISWCPKRLPRKPTMRRLAIPEHIATGSFNSRRRTAPTGRLLREPRRFARTTTPRCGNYVDDELLTMAAMRLVYPTAFSYLTKLRCAYVEMGPQVTGTSLFRPPRVELVF